MRTTTPTTAVAAVAASRRRATWTAGHRRRRRTIGTAPIATSRRRRPRRRGPAPRAPHRPSSSRAAVATCSRCPAAAAFPIRGTRSRRTATGARWTRTRTGTIGRTASARRRWRPPSTWTHRSDRTRSSGGRRWTGTATVCRRASTTGGSKCGAGERGGGEQQCEGGITCCVCFCGWSEMCGMEEKCREQTVVQECMAVLDDS